MNSLTCMTAAATGMTIASNPAARTYAAVTTG